MTKHNFNLRRLLFTVAAMIVCGGVGATATTFGTGNSTYEETSAGCYTVTLKAKGDLKSMEANDKWSYGSNVPWLNASKVTLVVDASVSLSDVVNYDELYLLTQNSNVPTLDLSNLTDAQADVLNPGQSWPAQWSTQSQKLVNIIVPAKYAANPQNYSKTSINSIGKSGGTVYLYCQSSTAVDWSVIRGSETTLKIVGSYNNNISVSSATSFETINLASATFTQTWIQVTVPTVGIEGVSLTKIVVSDDTMKNRIQPTDANTTAAIEIPSGGGGSGEGGEGGESGEGGGETVDQTTMAYKIQNKLQLSDAPTVYIELPEIGSETLGTYLYKIRGKGVNADDAPYRPASIKVVATTDTSSPHYMESFEEDANHLVIKVRGNSTALEGGNNTEGKRAYRLKFAKKDKTTGQNFKHDMINGGYSKRNWALLANVMDHSMLRNAVTCELGKIVGLPFNPGYKFVDLVINGDYRGTYQITDHPEVDGDRINVNEDTGWYVEFQGQQAMCDYPMFVTDPYFINVKNPEPTADEDTDEYNTQKAEILSAVSAWFGPNGWQKGFGDAFTDPKTGWRAYNDEETLMKWWIVTEITGDYDGMMTVKAYREADGKLHWGPVWDKDLAYGNYAGSGMGTADGSLVMNCTNSSDYMKTIFGKFAADPVFIKKVKDEMDRLVADNLKKKLCAKVDDLAIIIAPTEALNKDKWGYTSPQAGIQEQYHGDVPGYNEYAAYVDQLKDWIDRRIDYVQKELALLSTSANTASGFEYDVTAVTSDNISQKMSKLVNATMKNRSFTKDQWNTISLPFSVSETQLTSIFGSGYMLKEFSGVDGTKMLFTTPEGNGITGGYPYLIKPTKDVTGNIVFENVIVIANAKGWSDNFNYCGNSVSYGNYEFVAHLTKAEVGDRKAIDVNLNLSDFVYASANASQAFVRVKSSATTPSIEIVSDTPPVVRTQLTNIPTIYIDTQEGAAIQPSTGDYVRAAIELMDKNGTLTPFTETAEFLQIRGRGKAEWDVVNGKKSYRLKFAKKHKYDLTGGGYTKRNWVLAANAADESMIKNALTKKLGDELGLPFTPNCCFVDLVVNGEYKGTYTAMDFVEADREDGVSRRVDADEKTGWLLELTNEDGIDKTGDVYLTGTNYAKPWVNIKNPEPADNTDEAVSAVTSPVSAFIDNLWMSTQSYVDVSSLVNWYIASEMLGGTQTLSSVYAYKDAEETQLKFGPLWGNELSYQNSAMNDSEDSKTATGLIVNSATESALRNKLQSLWSESWFSSAVLTRWTVVKAGLADKLTTEADNLKTKISQSWTKNYTATASDGAGWTATSTLDADVNAIKTYVGNRINYLDVKFAQLAGNLVKAGDVDGNGQVNNADVVMLLLHTLGQTPAGFQAASADVNGDGRVDNADVVTLLLQTLNQ